MRKNAKNGLIAALLLIFLLSFALFAACTDEFVGNSGQAGRTATDIDDSLSGGGSAPDQSSSADNKVEVKFDTGYDNVVVETAYGVPGEQFAAPEAPEKDDMLFVCWQLGGEDYTFTVFPEVDTVLTAKWTADFYVVSFDTGDKSVSVASKKVPFGGTATEPEVAKDDGIL